MAVAFFVIRFVLCLWGSTLFLECKEPLTYIVQRDEQAHTHQHGTVFLNGNAHSAEQMVYKRLGDTVSDSITNGNVGNKSKYNFEVTLFILESIVLIQKIAQYTAEKVI